MRFHGGYYQSREKILDFSTNLNPLGTPSIIKDEIEHAILDNKIYQHYPDYTYTKLREAIATFYNIEKKYVIPTNGASEALNLAIIALNPRSITVVSPSYGDYELLCKSLSINCNHVLMKESNNVFMLYHSEVLDFLRKNPCDIVIIVNPNNPTGSIIDYDLIVDLAQELRNSGSWLIIDEAYAELSEYKSVLEFNAPENLVLIKSFTKMFSIPGLRLGFIYTTSPQVIERIDNIRSPWNVNSIADYVFKKVLIEYRNDLLQYMLRSREYVINERNFLVSRVRQLGFQVYESKTNFILLKHPWISAMELRDLLLNRYKILIRPAHTFYGLSIHYSRISVRKREENEFLVKALEEGVK